MKQKVYAVLVKDKIVEVWLSKEIAHKSANESPAKDYLSTRVEAFHLTPAVE